MPYTSNRPVLSGVVFDFVESGGVITNPGTTQIAFSTPIIYWISGVRYSASPATATATVSKDNYVDINAAGTITVTPVTTNAASPALAAGNIRLGIGVWGAATASSINQGAKTATAPTVSSNNLSVGDSLGNLIYPRDPNRRLLNYREITADFTTTAGPTDITGLNLTAIIPSGRDALVSGFIGGGSASVINDALGMVLNDVTAGAQIAKSTGNTDASGDITSVNPVALSSLGGTRNYKAQLILDGNAATVHTNSSATNPSFLMVQLF